MKIVKPKVEYWAQGDNKFDHIARCARVCYASDKTTKNEAMVNALVRNNHKSMLRHWSVYLKFDNPSAGTTKTILQVYFLNSPYCGFSIVGKNIYISTNEQYYQETYEKLLKYFDFDLNNYICTEKEVVNTRYCEKIIRYTMFVQTSIDISRELNRVSPNNIAEQSTRYVGQGSICESHFYDIIYDEVDFDGGGCLKDGKPIIPILTTDKYSPTDIYTFLLSCKNSFDDYHALLDLGFAKEDARKVLPLNTLTKCVYTYSLDEWNRILGLRLYGTTGRPHPDAKIIGQLIKNEFIKLAVEV